MSGNYHKGMFLMKQLIFKQYKYFVYRLTQKFSDTLWSKRGWGIIKAFCNGFTFYFTWWNQNIPFRCTEARFVHRIKLKISNIYWTMLGNGWKCILNCVSWFVSVILNFKALCIAYTVQRHCTDLLRSEVIEYFV